MTAVEVVLVSAVTALLLLTMTQVLVGALRAGTAGAQRLLAADQLRKALRSLAADVSSADVAQVQPALLTLTVGREQVRFSLDSQGHLWRTSGSDSRRLAADLRVTATSPAADPAPAAAAAQPVSHFAAAGGSIRFTLATAGDQAPTVVTGAAFPAGTAAPAGAP